MKSNSVSIFMQADSSGSLYPYVISLLHSLDVFIDDNEITEQLCEEINEIANIMSDRQFQESLKHNPPKYGVPSQLV